MDEHLSAFIVRINDHFFTASGLSVRVAMRLFSLLVAVSWCVHDIVGQWESKVASVKGNLFGTCTWNSISQSNNIQMDPGQFYVVSIKPAEEELVSYGSLLGMLTKTNPALGAGIVKGVPQADKWANQSGNSWQLAPDHPRNDKKNCVRVTRITGQAPTEIYEAYKKNADFYLVKAVNAFIHETGIVALPCGYFQPLEGCETMFKYVGRKWWNKCSDVFKRAKQQWPVYWKSGQDPQLDLFNTTLCRDNYKGPIERHSKVFVITAAWDHNYHHFMVDSLSRLVRHLDFLIENPDVKIHIRRYDQYAKEERASTGLKLRDNLIELLGLDPKRFISGVVLADEVFLPRAVKCNYPLASALELRLLASILKEKASLPLHGQPAPVAPPMKSSNHKRLLLQHRPCATEKECLTWRYWNTTVADDFATALARRFRTYKVQVTVENSRDPRLSDCMACQVAVYANTHVLVGLHGAGLTNMMFMPPGSLVVEIAGQFDGRMMPLCGYHGALAAVFGVHHYIHYYDWRGGAPLDVEKVAEEAATYYRFLLK